MGTINTSATGFINKFVESLKKNNHTQGMIGGVGLAIVAILFSDLINFDLSNFIASFFRP